MASTGSRRPRKVAPKRAPARRPGQPPRPGSTAKRLTSVTLAVRHNINGTVFGPGTVTVPKPVARLLMEQEQHVREEDHRFRSERAVIVRGDGKPAEVPYQSFDESLAAALPFAALK